MRETGRRLSGNLRGKHTKEELYLRIEELELEQQVAYHEGIFVRCKRTSRDNNGKRTDLKMTNILGGERYYEACRTT